jgi:hypothetical protein
VFGGEADLRAPGAGRVLTAGACGGSAMTEPARRRCRVDRSTSRVRPRVPEDVVHGLLEFDHPPAGPRGGAAQRARVRTRGPTRLCARAPPSPTAPTPPLHHTALGAAAPLTATATVAGPGTVDEQGRPAPPASATEADRQADPIAAPSPFAHGTRLYTPGAHPVSTDLTARDEPYIQYLTRIETLCTAYHNRNFAELTSLLGDARTRISRHAHKRTISEAVRRLDTLRYTGTIGDVLDLMSDGHLLPMPGKLKDLEHRRNATDLDERDRRRADFSNNLRDVSYREVVSVTAFIDELTPFSTQHGVKGDEFENDVVVIDDGAWTMYNMGKMLAGTDGPDRAERSQNLFYVCCSRARCGLAVVFLNDLPAGAESTARDWFDSGVVYP